MYKRLQLLCKEKGTNITHLCEEVTGSSGNLSTWKKGYMRSDYLSKVADILECSTDYILGRTDNLQNNRINNITTGNIQGDHNANIVNKETNIDEMTIELLKAFKALSFRERLEVLNDILKKTDN